MRVSRYLRSPAVLAGGVAIVLCACSGGAPPSSGSFPEAALTTVMSEGASFRVEVRTAPEQPLVVGLDSVELTVTDAVTGAPVDGLSVEMTPWMPSMGHGTSVVPILDAQGHGRYVFTNVSLFMPGEWQLRTTFSGAIDDRVAPVFDVP